MKNITTQTNTLLIITLTHLRSPKRSLNMWSESQQRSFNVINTLHFPKQDGKSNGTLVILITISGQLICIHKHYFEADLIEIWCRLRSLVDKPEVSVIRKKNPWNVMRSKMNRNPSSLGWEYGEVINNFSLVMTNLQILLQFTDNFDTIHLNILKQMRHQMR